MEHTKMDVAGLMVHLHESVDSIHRAMLALSDTSAHDAEIAKLEEECERMVEELRGKHEGLKRQAEERRRKEEEQIREKRVREEIEIMERRKREDEERRRRLEREEQQREMEMNEEDERREREREEGERGAKRGAEEKIERLEGEMRRRWEEGRARVRELDEKRKEVNRKIDEMLSLPMEFPKVQSRRTTKDSKREILSKPSSHMAQHTPYRDDMLDRLWSEEKYICERYFQGPLRPDPMLSRLWNGHKYTAPMHFGPRQDPMFARLWNDRSYGEHQADPMLSRLWNGERYGPVATVRMDPMLRRLWSDTRYPSEKHASSGCDPMMERLWSNRSYQYEKYIDTKYDPMLSRLWNGERYDQRRPSPYQNDPMMARLWGNERYTMSGFQDPMMSRLWSDERYTSNHSETIQDPMMRRLWAATRYREDPMITRLWATVRYREDPMLDRLWDKASYSNEEEPEFELNNVLWVSEPTIKSPIPRSPIPTNLYNLDSKFPGNHVSEFHDSSDEEDDSIDNIVNSSQRHSGVFTAFFNSIKTDIPLVNDYLRSQEYANVPDDEFDDFVAQPLLYHAPDEQHVHFEDLLEDHSESRVHEYAYSTEHEDDAEVSDVSEVSEEEDDEEFPFRHDTSGLRIQTTSLPIHANSGPAGLSFENLTQFPSSGAPSSPATPSDTASHTFQELHHGSVSSISIPASWSPPREELHLAIAPQEAKQDRTTNQFVSYIPPSSGIITGGEIEEERERPASKRGVSGYFNNVPQNPRLSRDLGRMFGGFKGERKEAADEEREEARSDGRAVLKRLSKMAGGLYYGGSGEEKGRLLEE